jgi:hypothetical protein
MPNLSELNRDPIDYCYPIIKRGVLIYTYANKEQP